ncbi:MAG: shikimate kinase [Planctomycetota bacterium]|nr:shikimate kinase [Planctomycetota bacterium]
MNNFDSQSHTCSGNIVLIGMRGAGKSTFGLSLAEALSMPLIDLDDVIATLGGRDVDALLFHEGEERFRMFEEQALEQAALEKDTIIATGGGAPLNASAFSRLAETGLVVFLEQTLEVLQKRAQERPRPSLTDLEPSEEVLSLLEARTPVYERMAEITIPGDHPEPILAVTAALNAGTDVKR